VVGVLPVFKVGESVTVQGAARFHEERAARLVQVRVGRARVVKHVGKVDVS
jgi:hypothetical protein